METRAKIEEEEKEKKKDKYNCNGPLVPKHSLNTRLIVTEPVLNVL